jgi:hypothetical protein
VNITEYVAELKVHCENSGLDNHRGLIIAALMKKCVSGSFLGRRVRASLKATEQAIIQEHVAAGGTPETAKTSWHDNTLAARYLQDVFSQLMDTADECTETNLDLKRRWRELRFLESESLVEYFDRSQDLTILLQERGIPKCSDDVVLDVLQGLRIRTDAVNPLFYTTLALTECTTLSDLRIRTRNLHRVMPAEFMSQIPLTAHERVSGEEAVRVAGLGDTQTPNSLKASKQALPTALAQVAEAEEPTQKFVASDFVKPCKRCTLHGKPADQHSWAFCRDNPLNIHAFTDGHVTLGSNKRAQTEDNPHHHPKRQRDMRRVKCYNCKEMGHIARNCPQKGDTSESRAAIMKDVREELHREQVAAAERKKQRQSEMVEVFRMAMAQAKTTAGAGDTWPPQI